MSEQNNRWEIRIRKIETGWLVRLAGQHKWPLSQEDWHKTREIACHTTNDLFRLIEGYQIERYGDEAREQNDE